mmetsp:Transcript_14309/g.48356  ORF Transcript_14309/g.48356 Transcript_14309/m.48356 type:complete len:328 (-) Transcript_14309:83-1066(-)
MYTNMFMLLVSSAPGAPSAPLPPSRTSSSCCTLRSISSRLLRSSMTYGVRNSSKMLDARPRMGGSGTSGSSGASSTRSRGPAEMRRRELRASASCCSRSCAALRCCRCRSYFFRMPSADMGSSTLPFSSRSRWRSSTAARAPLPPASASKRWAISDSKRRVPWRALSSTVTSSLPLRESSASQWRRVRSRNSMARRCSTVQCCGKTGRKRSSMLRSRRLNHAKRRSMCCRCPWPSCAWAAPKSSSYCRSWASMKLCTTRSRQALPSASTTRHASASLRMRSGSTTAASATVSTTACTPAKRSNVCCSSVARTRSTRARSSAILGMAP